MSFVCEVTNKKSKSWKEDGVKEIFNEDEDEIICNIPISKRGSDDKL